MEGFHRDNLCIILPGVNGRPRYHYITEDFNWLSRAHERYRRQTDRQQHIANVNGSSHLLIGLCGLYGSLSDYMVQGHIMVTTFGTN